jgi:hypothetical protein
MLDNARRGLEDISSPDAGKRIPGLHNVAVFGRAVTIALQRLRHIVDGFDDWYGAQVPQNDPLLSYFNKVRNEILKEAVSPPIVSLGQTMICGPAGVLEGFPPAGATEMFTGEDGTGGSGWFVALPDGTQVKYYAALLPVHGSMAIHLPEAPREFLGESFTDSTAAGVAGRYVAWLARLVDDAEHRFT